MAIPTTRTNEQARISIDLEKCIGCGKCIDVCKDLSLVLKDGKVSLASEPVFGCIGCGHCMAICPSGAIEVNGRYLSPKDLFELPPKEKAAGYEELQTLYQRRRSIREFRDEPVSSEKIKKILEAAKMAPMGLPPSDVNVLVLDTKEKNHLFAKDFCDYLEQMQWMVSGWFLAFMRPFWGKANAAVFRNFVKPLFRVYTEKMRQGTNLVTYDAPLAMYFYGSPYADPADPVVAATTAMYAAESLGLGTCMVGGVHPLIQHGGKAKKFREKYGIKFKSREGLFILIGYPQWTYKKGVRRTFASVVNWN